MLAVGEGLVAGGKPFRGLACGRPVPIIAEIQMCRGVLDNNGHGLIVADFIASARWVKSPDQKKRPD